MINIDINCDLGEGTGNDESVMPFISSANIACGYHAGDNQTMDDTIKLAIEYGVSIGSHPGYKDKDNFGRTNMNLSYQEIKILVKEQIIILEEKAKNADIRLNHVKPHGALYNQASKDINIASAIAEAITEVDRNLIYVGLANSVMQKAAKIKGLRFWAEAFADRAYTNDGFLAPRNIEGAVIEDAELCKKRVLKMVTNNKVTSVNGNEVEIKADTICIHGDNEHAIELAQSIYEYLKRNNISIKAV